MTDFDALSLTGLRARRSAKWRTFDADVLPMPVAELDVPLAPAVTRVLQEAVAAGDTGYTSAEGCAALAAAFSGAASRWWGWDVDPARCATVADVMVGVGEALRLLTPPGSPVVVCPPVYAPFFSVPAEFGHPPVQVPLVDGGLDLDGIAAALRDGAAAVLLCNPHNPTGRAWSPEELDALDEVVDAHGALVVSDEIHAPLALPGRAAVPYLSRGDRRGVAVVSPSKAFNLAGLKAALLVAGSGAVAERLADLPYEVPYRSGHLGVLAGAAAWAEGDAWLAGLRAHLARNHDRLAELLAERLPAVRVTRPDASFLAWLDCRSVTGTPAAQALERGRLALVEGTDFGAEGRGFARMNVGTTLTVLEEGVERLVHALGPG